MRYFFDTEFIDGKWSLDLISLGVVAEDGREFYAVNDAVHTYSPNVSEWLRSNVFDKLQPVRSPKVRALPLDAIRDDLLAFIGDDPSPEFWAYYGAHDWVALCWLMGGMLNLPAGWPWICLDLRRELDRAGLESVKDDGRADEHNALADARWVAAAHREHLHERREAGRG